MTDHLHHYPYFPDDFQRKTRHLTLLQKGAFRELLDEMWLTNQDDGTIPDDPTYCANVLRVSESEWMEIRAVLVDGPRPVLSSDNGRLYSRRLQEELDNAKRLVSVARENGKRGGKGARLGTTRLAGAKQPLSGRLPAAKQPLSDGVPPAKLPEPEPIEAERELGAAPSPNWEAVERLVPIVTACRMTQPPDEQILGMLVQQFGEELCEEVFRNRSPNLVGKTWKYAQKILESWRDNPDERPSRKAAAGTNRRGTEAEAGRGKIPSRFAKYDTPEWRLPDDAGN